MYNLTKNNYHLKPKNSNIYTPQEVSQFIFELLKDKRDSIWDWRSTYNMRSHILDPCCGKGSLLEPWRTKSNYLWDGVYPTVGIDLDPNSSANWKIDFLSLTQTDFYRKFGKPQLILCNPPFNGYGNKLGSEVWLDKIIELFGKEVPIVLFVPMGFCANLTLESKRLEKFNNGTYPPIVSRITLPKNIFESVIFHSEILIFNIKGLKPHYFFKPHDIH
jgi:type I restriction enzyme M protein